MHESPLDVREPIAATRATGGRPRADGAHQGGGGRVAELDALRGLAAVAVVVFHFNPKILPAGWAAVDLFFVLSGYLITGIILRHGGSRGFLARFYARRGLRVWPIYYLTVLALAAAAPALSRPVRWEGLPYVLTFTQGVPRYWSDQAPVFTWYLGHTWTLAIEEQFYLLWPALVGLVGRRGVVPLALACAGGSALARGGPWGMMLLGTRCDGLALGALLAAWLDRAESAGEPGWRDRSAARLGAVAAGAFVVLAGLRVAAGPSAFAAVPRWPGPTILAINALWLGLVGYVACRAGSRGLAPLRSRPLARLGEISYGLYLYHFPILLLAGDLARRAGFRDLNVWLKSPTLAACLGAAWASWVVLERPILRLKDRFPYRDGREGTGPAGPHPRVASPGGPPEIPSHPAVGPGTCFSESRSGIPTSQVPPPA